MNYLEKFRAARRASAPILVVRCPDYITVIREVMETYKEIPLLRHDVCSGVIGVNTIGVDAAEAINANDPPQAAGIITGNAVDALTRSLEFMPEGGMLFCLNLHLALEDLDSARRTGVTQAIWNCRDPFKSSKRTLVLLCPDLKVPAELANDVVVIDVDLPTDLELEGIVKSQLLAGGHPEPETVVLSSAVNAVSGLSAFAAEQVAASSLTKEGIHIPSMWEQKRTIIRQSGGLSVDTREVSFDSLGGLEQIKKFLALIIRGKRKPRLVVLVDEIDRQLSGIGDSSGVGGDAYQQVLSNLQDNEWGGVLFPGFAGCGKTEMAHAMGCEAGGLFIKLDLGGMQDKFVGESQKKIRNAMQTLKAMGGRDVFFVGTTNNAQSIRPELKRRFNYGTFFFDLPTPEEQQPIWDIYLKKFQLPEQERPPCREWTGAEIRKVCELSDTLGLPLLEASQFITPVAKSMGDDVKSMRTQAHGRYLDASRPGFYRAQTKALSPNVVRKLESNN